MSTKSSKKARQPKKITTNRAIFAGVLVGTPDTNVMETERSVEHFVESRRSSNIQTSSRYSK
ncbi:12173_t:CDS:1, partial [Gigaspora rosea]